MSEQEQRISWKLIKKPAPQYMGGMIHHWSGLDTPIENNWVDKIGGVKFIPNNVNNVEHRGNHYFLKYAGNLTAAGYVTDVTIPTEGYTFELVTRSLATSSKTYWSASNGMLLDNGGLSSWNERYNPQLSIRTTWKEDKVFTGMYFVKGGTVLKADLNLVDTFTYVLGTADDPVSKTYHNGVLLGEGALTNAGIRKLGLGTRPYGDNITYYNAANLGVYDIRIYPTRLTDEQVLNNHEVDLLTYIS